ncbi:MAG TPA: cation:proton antiporter regulatory subunit [Acidimicrobiia bacterium]|nr:cation:proton antiporter regulatory subunit [Acidimicrobiia bacterium]
MSSPIQKTSLPGFGVRYDFVTAEGTRVGVVHHRTGWRELFISPADDPDSVANTVTLTEEEAHTLVDVLGGSQVVEDLSHLQQHIEGLAIDWLQVETGHSAAGKTIGDLRLRTLTGVSVVAVLRGAHAFPAPEPTFLIEAHDVLVVVGTPRGIVNVATILRSG